MPVADENVFRFVWWNVGGLASFDRRRVAERGWPRSAEESEAQFDRIAGVFNEIGSAGRIHLVALGEITRQAAEQLVARVFPGYSLYSPDFSSDARHSLALLFDPKAGLVSPGQLPIPYAPGESRPMVRLDLLKGRDRIRIYGCHWPAFETPTSRKTRVEAASHLNRSIYNFTREAGGEQRHAVILGDLNEEPFSPTIQEHLHAYRDRGHARQREHRADAASLRVRMYNCSWRHLGEMHPHGEEAVSGPAGTFFWEKQRTWHSPDQILVTGSLLEPGLPRLEEREVRVFSGKSLLLVEGKPYKFDWGNGRPQGVSDHLPLVGGIRLSEEISHADP